MKQCKLIYTKTFLLFNKYNQSVIIFVSSPNSRDITFLVGNITVRTAPWQSTLGLLLWCCCPYRWKRISQLLHFESSFLLMASWQSSYLPLFFLSSFMEHNISQKTEVFIIMNFYFSSQIQTVTYIKISRTWRERDLSGTSFDLSTLLGQCWKKRAF